MLACQEELEICCCRVKQEGAQLSNYSTISSNSRLIVNCSSVPATSTELKPPQERRAGGSSPADPLSLLAAKPSQVQGHGPQERPWGFQASGPTPPTHPATVDGRGGEEPCGLLWHASSVGGLPGAASKTPISPSWAQGTGATLPAWDHPRPWAELLGSPCSLPGLRGLAHGTRAAAGSGLG